ncbi:hypothetical protein D3C79_848490 [compost metagenome]
MPGDELVELRAVAFAKQQPTAIAGQILQALELHRSLAIDEHRHFFAQHRHPGKTHALVTLVTVVGQHHVYPAFGGVEQTALPVAQHNHLDLVAQSPEQLAHHGWRQAAHLLAVAPGHRRVHRIVAIADALGGLQPRGQQQHQQAQPAAHGDQAATLAVNR